MESGDIIQISGRSIHYWVLCPRISPRSPRRSRKAGDHPYCRDRSSRRLLVRLQSGDVRHCSDQRPQDLVNGLRGVEYFPPHWGQAQPPPHSCPSDPQIQWDGLWRNPGDIHPSSLQQPRSLSFCIFFIIFSFPAGNPASAENAYNVLNRFGKANHQQNAFDGASEDDFPPLIN